MIPRTLRYGVLYSLVVLLLGVTNADADASDQEYLVKATFLYNFTKFVTWPAEKTIANVSSVDICVVGNSPISETGEVFKKASSSKLRLSLVKEKNPRNAIAHCHIVFIGKSEESKAAELLSLYAGQPVLTVSDIDDFAENGGMVGFMLRDNKVKLTINTKAASASQIRVDSQLLEIALKVINQ